jgi:hypothetical protein
MPWAKTINRMLNEPAGELSSREKDKSAKKLNIGLIASANACARGSIIIGPATQHYLSILLEGSGEREDSTKDGLRLLSLSLINKFN